MNTAEGNTLKYGIYLLKYHKEQFKSDYSIFLLIILIFNLNEPVS